MKKLTINCSLASSSIAFSIAIFFKSNLSSRRWRFSLLTYRINLKHARITSYLALIYKRHQNLDISIYIKSLKKANRYTSFIFALKFLISNISKWRIISSNCKYHCSCLNARHEFELEFEKRFHLFFCVLITNEHRMFAQKSAKENALLSYEMTRYSRIFHVLIILSLRCKKRIF